MISILGETLQPLDEDGLIPAYGFGDVRTQGHSIFPLKVYVSTCLFIDADSSVMLQSDKMTIWSYERVFVSFFQHEHSENEIIGNNVSDFIRYEYAGEITSSADTLLSSVTLR